MRADLQLFSDRPEGFSLIEVLMAMGLLSFGLLLIAGTQLASIHMTARSKYLTDAVNLAQEQVEAFQAMPLTTLPGAGTWNDPANPIPHPNPQDLTTFTRRWIVASNSPATGITMITVEVDWVDKNGSTQTTRLRSMRGL